MINSIVLIGALSIADIPTPNYEVSVGYSQVEHSWTQEGKSSMFTPTMMNVRGTAWFNNLGVSLFYGDMDRTFNETQDYYKLAIDFKHIYGVELSYKYHINKNLYVIAGIGSYVLPMNQIAFNEDDSVSYMLEDNDNDQVWFFGAGYNITDKLSVEYMYNRYSNISRYDEYTEGVNFSLVYKF